MDKIIKKDGYIWAVENYLNKGFETYRKLGKDPDDPRWFEEVKQIEEEIKKKRIRKNKVEE